MTDKLREAAAMHIASYQQKLTNLYNRKVKSHAFQAEDLVLRRVFENTVDPTARKFQPNWEGLYMIVKVGAAGSYALNKLDGMPVTKMWNAMHLKRYLLSIKFSLEYFLSIFAIASIQKTRFMAPSLLGLSKD